MTTVVRAVLANGDDVGTWNMSAVPREGDGLLTSDGIVYMVSSALYWPESAGGTLVTMVVVPTGKRIP
jgi:hypothetical protein